ncbi:fasciclin-2 isoform X1 [Amyelois transitella]|uniref:fasciclin-2 isoform X1 n=2 Tax=Amyelois transitella TaxID=680683 RepID=UPI0029906804|nr:fasciclin-2 isoform X1 [Amyelois transitella]
MLKRNFISILAVFCLFIMGILACNEGKITYSEERKAVGEALYKECYCTSNENEIVKPKWFGPGDTEIRPGSNSGIETEQRGNILSLFIKKLSISMIGTFKCICECNGKPNILEQLELKVYNPLEIINTPADQMIVLGNNSKIKCEGWGGLGERYTWWEKPMNKESHKYNEVEDGLIINNVTEDDRGIFVCFVSDMETGAEVNRSINVKVITKPKVLDIHADPHTTVVAGDTLILECIAEGTPKPVTTWQIDEPVVSSTKKKHKMGDNVSFKVNRLIFDNITAEDHGTYQCTASNIVGNDSNKISIEVFVPPEIIEFNDTTAVEGTTMQIICNAKGRPEPNVSILYIGKDVNGSKGITDEILITSPFMPVTPSVEGYYVCNATNDVDFETSTMYLTVLHKPIFETDIEIMWGWDNVTITLSCINDANPKAILSWSFETNPENASAEKLHYIQQLIHNLEESQEQYIAITLTNTTNFYGTFQCLARNEYGEALKTIFLKQGFPPSNITNVVGDIRSTEVMFHIQKPTNYEGPDVIGYIAEYDISDNYDVTDIHQNRTWSIDREAEGFVLSDLIPNTTYHIRFAAINDVGIGEWNTMFVFTTRAPSFPSAPTWDSSSVVVNATEHRVLKWTAPVDNGATIDYYLIRYCYDCSVNDSCKELKVMSTMEFHTDVLEPNATYCVEVRAHNQVGVSEAANITVTVAALTIKKTLSAGAIIGIAIVIVFIAFVILDVLLCVWKKQGMIASFYYKKSRKRKSQIEQTRDKKGLLKDNSTSADNTKNHKEFEYNKTTGIITGKHSSV